MTTEPTPTFIESPYAGDIEANVAYARRCMADSLRRGEAPFAGHLLYTQAGILDDTIAEERTRGMESAFLWARKAEAQRAFYMDRGVSTGMLGGLCAARHCGASVVLRWLDPEAEIVVPGSELGTIWQLFGAMSAARALKP